MASENVEERLGSVEDRHLRHWRSMEVELTQRVVDSD